MRRAGGTAIASDQVTRCSAVARHRTAGLLSMTSGTTPRYALTGGFGAAELCSRLSTAVRSRVYRSTGHELSGRRDPLPLSAGRVQGATAASRRSDEGLFRCRYAAQLLAATRTATHEPARLAPWARPEVRGLVSDPRSTHAPPPSLGSTLSCNFLEPVPSAGIEPALPRRCHGARVCAAVLCH